MATTYEPIATTTLGSAAATITFSSISSAYTDLRLVLIPTASTSTDAAVRFNSDTATNYSLTYLSGNGTSASSGNATNQNRLYLTWIGPIQTATPIMKTLDIFSYAGSTYKTCLGTNSSDLNGSGTTSREVHLWRSTAAINRIDILMSSGTFNTGTTATLYGILRA